MPRIKRTLSKSEKRVKALLSKKVCVYSYYGGKGSEVHGSSNDFKINTETTIQMLRNNIANRDYGRRFTLFHDLLYENENDSFEKNESDVVSTTAAAQKIEELMRAPWKRAGPPLDLTDQKSRTVFSLMQSDQKVLYLFQNVRKEEDEKKSKT